MSKLSYRHHSSKQLLIKSHANTITVTLTLTLTKPRLDKQFTRLIILTQSLGPIKIKASNHPHKPPTAITDL